MIFSRMHDGTPMVSTPCAHIIRVEAAAPCLKTVRPLQLPVNDRLCSLLHRNLLKNPHSVNCDLVINMLNSEIRR